MDLFYSNILDVYNNVQSNINRKMYMLTELADKREETYKANITNSKFEVHEQDNK